MSSKGLREPLFISGLCVELTHDELVQAARVGCARHVEALLARRQDQYGYDGSDGWNIHIEGACGELAFAKAIGAAWDESVQRFRGMGTDVDEFQVKTRSKHSYDLLVRPDADPSELYVLVTGSAPTYYVRGWARAGDVMRPEFLQQYANRPQAYFVPVTELRSVQALLG